MEKLWGGRFQKKTSHLMEDFHASIHFDAALYPWDIAGSIAHARMLGAVGVLSSEEAETIEEGLRKIYRDIDAGNVTFTAAHEDIHMNIEVLLTEAIGPLGKKLHTGRSRNDQVAVDLRMYLRYEVIHTIRILLELIQTLITKAEQEKETILPGYTHLQRAQPISFAHHLMAYVAMFSRDVERLFSWLERNNKMALGSGALAGTTYPLDREMTASLLLFDAPTENSLDGVSDRDFVLDYMHAASTSMMHLSRLSEEVVLWASQEFGFIQLDDAYSTGSSIMPQKKNPDVAELVRGKSGRVYGHLMAMLTTMKGLPLAYNKDMQEDKEGLFDTVATWQKCMMITIPMLETMQVQKNAMRQAAQGGFTNATDLADYLVGKGLAFRDAHRAVGEMVAYALDQSINLEDISLDMMQTFSDKIDEDIFEAIAIETCVAERKTLGGPSDSAVSLHIRQAKEFYENKMEKLSSCENFTLKNLLEG